MGGNNDFAPFVPPRQCFTVRNIANPKKTIKIFHNPIPQYEERDLLKIRGVSESDIRASLLKGELYHKILAREIVITCSDIDLLQFNVNQKIFLKQAGVLKGTEITGEQIENYTITSDKLDPSVLIPGGAFPFYFRQQIQLIGTKNGSNRTFTTPHKFINGPFFSHTFKIQIKHNGRVLEETKEYLVQESVPTLGYDTIVIVAFAPKVDSELFADYVSVI